MDPIYDGNPGPSVQGRRLKEAGGRGRGQIGVMKTSSSAAGLLEPPPLLDLPLAPSVLLPQGGHDV